MPNLIFDFRNTVRGQVVKSTPIAYQWDQGHIAEIYVTENATYEIQYSKYSSDEAECYAVDSLQSIDNGYVITAHIPNSYFETVGNLNLYIVGSADGQVITRYQGLVEINTRVEPDDYVDPDPDNSATTVLEAAEDFANESEAWATGTIDGVDVDSDAEQYHNNAKYYAEQASAAAENLETMTVDLENGRLILHTL